jgi:hypothetical protein
MTTDLGYGRDYIGWLSCYGSNPNQTRGDWKKTYTVARLEKLIKRFGADKFACALAGSAFDSLSSNLTVESLRHVTINPLSFALLASPAIAETDQLRVRLAARASRHLRTV